jgi:hypothetical protein
MGELLSGRIPACLSECWKISSIISLVTSQGLWKSAQLSIILAAVCKISLSAAVSVALIERLRREDNFGLGKDEGRLTGDVRRLSLSLLFELSDFERLR